MKYKRISLGLSRVAALSLSMFLMASNSVAQQGEPTNNPSMDAGKARVIEYWNQDRRQGARPRDLVIDPRGLGYLRRPGGSLEPYGHQITAEATSGSPGPMARPSSSDDSTPPSIANMDPIAGETIDSSATFSATVTDESGVRSVSLIITYPDGVTTQTFQANEGANDVWSITLHSFTDGDWSWSVEARDNAKRGGNTRTVGPVAFTVDTGGGSDTSNDDSDTVTNAEWNLGGDVQTALGRIYFEMPNNAKRKGPWGGYVCSGTVVNEAISGRSIILTAAHCVYDDVNKAYARNVLFIPDQAGTTASRTDTNCNNDPLGCWVPSFGVVDDNWTTRTFPDNIPWDYAYYVVNDVGAHAGADLLGALDGAAKTLGINFSMPNFDDPNPGATSGGFTHALGYSYSEDPKLMFCAEDMTTEGSANWWLPSCGLSGGSSGGSWVQSLSSGTGLIISVNSWGYSNQPGMAGPMLDVSSAKCVFDNAILINWNEIVDSDGEAGRAIFCSQT